MINAKQLVTNGKQMFIVTNEFSFDSYEIKVVIDFDYPNINNAIKEMSMFWADNPGEKASFEEHLENALKMLAFDMYTLQVLEDHNFKAAVEKFKTREGFCYPLDGSKGILIVSTHFQRVEVDDFLVEKQEEFARDLK